MNTVFHTTLRYLTLGGLCAGLLPAVHAAIPTKTVALPYINDFVWDTTRSRIFASAGSTIVMINPETAQVEDTIASGDFAQRIAVSDDGLYLYAAIGSRSAVRRYRIQDHALDLEFSLRGASGASASATTMVVLPGQPRSVLLARGSGIASNEYSYPLDSQAVAVYDDAVQRPLAAALNVISLYVRRSDNSIHGWSNGHVYKFAVDAAGVRTERSALIPEYGERRANWSGRYLVVRDGTVFDLDTYSLLGRVPYIGSSAGGSYCALATDATETSVLVALGDERAAGQNNLFQYSIQNFRATAGAVVELDRDFFRTICVSSSIGTWGEDGIAIAVNTYRSMLLLHASDMKLLAPAPPAPQAEAGGVIRIRVAANDLVYDAGRNVVWATIAGTEGQIGNTVVSIEPGTGRIVDSIDAGSEPDRIALSPDGNTLFTTLQGSGAVTMIDIDARQRSRTFSLTDTSYWTPQALATVTDRNDSVAVVRRSTGVAYGSDITVYDSGVPRPQTVSNITTNIPPADARFEMSVIFPGDVPNAFYAVNTASHYGDFTHEVLRLIADSNGIHVDRPLTHLGGDALTYDTGKIFAGNGQLWSSDTSQLLGSFAGTGVPLVFADHGRVTYIQKSGVTVFDIATMRPVAELPIPPSLNPPPTPAPPRFNAVWAGAETIAITTGHEIFLIPLAALRPWRKYSPTLQTVAPGLQRMELPVNAMSSLPGTSKLVLATPSAAGDLGNSLITFDPRTGVVASTVLAGSEPSLLATSPDGTSVNAWLAGELRVARVDTASQTRQIAFPANPDGGSRQYAIYDMVSGSAGSVAVSYYGGAVAVFDHGRPRAKVERNTEGQPSWGQNGPVSLRLAFDPSGTLLYGTNTFLSTFELKRFAVSPEGVKWLSTAGALIAGYDVEVRYAGGLLYGSNGVVVDPERSRRVGQFPLGELAFTSDGVFKHVWPDTAARRVYLTTRRRVVVFDMDSYARLGLLDLNMSADILSLVKFSETGLAFHTNDGKVFLLDTSAIPILPAPIPSPQRSLPSTSGVRLIDLATRDLAYDSLRNLIYATTPNSEAAFGDSIAAIDPRTAKVAQLSPAGLEPRLLALSKDNSRLYYSSGFVNTIVFSRDPLASEAMRAMDLTTGNIGPNFAAAPPGEFASHAVLDLTVVQGRPESVAVIYNLSEVVFGKDSFGTEVYTWFNRGPSSIRVYDGGIQRKNTVSAPAFSCTSIQPGSTESRLYCASAGTFSKLNANADGVSLSASTSLVQTNVPRMLFSSGRIFTNTGLVIDPETMTVIAQAPAHGAVAVDGGRVYWLVPDPEGALGDQPTVTLRAFNASNLQPLGEKKINVTATDVTRLVACGPGCLAFRAGKEVYIADIESIVESGPGPGTYSFSAAGGGGVSRTTAGQSASLVAGYASIQHEINSGPVAGFGIFGFRQNDVLVTEASVPASTLLRAGRIYTEVNGPVNTGLAIVNPNGDPAVITYNLTDGAGRIIRGGGLTIPPFGKIAAFLNQPPFYLDTTFSASFTFDSTVPVSVVALRGFTNERSEFLLTTLPVTDLDAPPAGVQRFPHFADGAGWTTQLVLINPGGSALAGTIEFRNPAGSPVLVTINGRTSSSFSYSIPARSFQKLQTAGVSASTVSGSVLVTPESGTRSPSGIAIFSFRSGGITVTEAGIPASPTGTTFRLYAEVSGSFGERGSIQTGVAVMNASAGTATVLLELINIDGTSTGQTGSVSIAPNGQIAAFLNQLSGFVRLQTPFQGILRVSSSTPISILGLRGRYNERDDFIISTTPPMDESQPPARGTLYFPHIVDSGGYTMQFILLNPDSNQPAPGTLRFFSTTGQPLDVTVQ